jgi:hypothetical protein
MQAACAGKQLPTLKVTMALVHACGGDEQAWRDYWTQVKHAIDLGDPAAASAVIDPPRSLSSVHAAKGSLSVIVGSGSDPAAHVSKPRIGSHDAPDGWYVEHFSALLRMDVPQPEAVENRSIVATVDGLRELATSISVPRGPGDTNESHTLNAELLYGGLLTQREQPYESYFRTFIALPRPLRSGDRHEYQMLFRIPPGQQMATHYVYVPFNRTDSFDLRIRFSADKLPASIWALSGVPPSAIYEPASGGPGLITPDIYGEVRIHFRDLRIGLGYGIRWQD